MRKKRTSIVCCIMAILMAGILSLSGCGFFEFGGGGGTSSVAPKTYTIQYTDDAGTHTLEVEDGSPYSLESIPRREGYDFIVCLTRKWAGRSTFCKRFFGISVYGQAEHGAFPAV